MIKTSQCEGPRILRISKWSETFETARSREYKRLNWVSVPIGFNSNGFADLIETFGDDAPAMYGAWIAVVQIAAECPTRGTLVSSSGVAITTKRMQMKSHFPAEIFDRLIEWATSPNVGWLIPVLPDESLTSNVHVTDKGAVGPPESSNSTLHNKHNGTKQNNDDNDDKKLLSSLSSSLLSAINSVEHASVIASANRLAKAAPKVDKKLIWDACWVGMAIDSDFVDELIANLNEATSKRKYIAGAIRKKCREVDCSFCLARKHTPQPSLSSKEAGHAHAPS